MNSSTKFFACLIFVISAIAAVAAPAKTAVVSGATTGVYKLIYRTAEAQKVKISIYNTAKELIFTETLANVESFIRPYNLNSLSQGEYTFVIEDKSGRTEEKVNYFFKKVESTVEVNKIANEAGKYLLSVENTDSDMVDVKILDSESNVLHQQAMTVNGKFSVIYNLTSINGPVTFEVVGSNGLIKSISF